MTVTLKAAKRDSVAEEAGHTIGFPSKETFLEKMPKFLLAYRKLFLEISHFFSRK